jgi:hypothetical protein
MSPKSCDTFAPASAIARQQELAMIPTGTAFERSPDRGRGPARDMRAE